MAKKPISVDSIREKIESRKITVESDNPIVEQTRILTDAVRLLADDKNEIFSQLDKKQFLGIDETYNFALTYSFADNPLEDVEQILAEAGIKETVMVKDEGEYVQKEIPFRFDIPVLKKFAVEWLKRRHNVNRSRVQEYIDALEAGSMKFGAMRSAQTEQNLSMPGRGRIV